MKMVVAFVQPFMAERIIEALHRVEGLSGATFTKGQGFGRGRGGQVKPTHEDLFGTTGRLRVEAVVADALVDVVVRAITDAAHTGKKGDGKIYVLPVDQALRIRTGEEGEAAI